MSTLLLSGGVDSVAVLSSSEPARTVFVDYGQPASAQERAAAKRWADRFDCEHFEFAVTGIQLGEMAAASGVPGPRVVQARNAILVGVAANVTPAGGTVLIGAHLGDAENYPDCRPGFITRMNQAFRDAYDVGVVAPLIALTRHEILDALREKHVEFQSCWSCYAPLPNGQQCGACNSCKQ